MRLINCPVSEENIHHVLKQAQLDTVEVTLHNNNQSNDTDYSSMMDLNPSQFAALTSLNLPKQTSQATQSLLSKAPRLQKITLRNVDLDWEKIDFTYVKEIAFEGVTLSPSRLQQIITLAPSLEKLVFEDTVLKSDKTTFQLPRLPKLTELIFNNTSGDENQIAYVLTNQAPNLLSFVVIGEYLLGTDWRRVNFSCVTAISLCEATVDSSLFQKITREAPNLKTLELMENTYSFTECEPLDLPKLKNLRVEFNNVSDDNFHIMSALLYSLPNLEILQLLNMTLDDIDWEQVKLDTLRQLDISYSYIASKNFSTLLELASALEKIDVDNSTIQGAPIAWDKIRVSIKNLHSLCDDETEKDETEEDENHYTREAQREPCHDRDRLLKFRPQSEKTFQFKFSGKNKTYSHSMFVEKLSQYLTLKQQHTDIIYKLQDGICFSLVMFFLESDWQSVSNRIRDWDGTNEHLTKKLEEDFNTLYGYVQKYNLKNKHMAQYYLGDNLRVHLESAQRSMVLKTQWHAVGLQYIQEQNCWLYYDANSPIPPKIILNHIGHLERLIQLIHNSLGPLVSVVLDETRNFPYTSGIHDPERFIQEGGLFDLVWAKNNSAMLDALAMQENYSEDSLEGLLLRTMSGVPAWCIGLRNEFTKTYTATLLHQFACHYPEEHYDKLIQSLKALPEEKQKEYLSLLPQIDIYPVPEEVEEQEENEYEIALETWAKQKGRYNNPQRYYESLILANNNKKS